MSNFGRTGGGGMYALPSVNRARMPASDDPDRQAAIKRDFEARQEEAAKINVGDEVTCPGGEGWLKERTGWGTYIVRFKHGGRSQSYHPNTVTKGWKKK